RKIRHELLGQMRSQKVRGITAARLKRMPSVRRKLQRLPIKLHRVQDLAGCRAVVENMEEVNAVIKALRRGSAHQLHKEYPYIQTPKSDGYRSHHMVFEFVGLEDNKPYTGRRVEIQIRTRLQHSWATTVEAVGLFRHE